MRCVCVFVAIIGLVIIASTPVPAPAFPPAAVPALTPL